MIKPEKVSIKTNFIYNAIFQVTSIVVPLVTMPYLTRVLHADGIGRYSFAYSVAYYFYLFVRLGLHSYGNRTIAYVKGDKSELSKTFFSIYAFQVLAAVVMSALYAGYIMLIAPDKKLAWIYSLLVITGGIDLTWMMDGLEEFRITAIRDAIIKIVTVICIFVFVKKAEDVWVYAFIYSAGAVISRIVVLPIVASRVNYVRPTISDVLSHIKPNLTLFLPTIAVSLYRVMDNIMLGAMTDDAELGFYHTCDSMMKVPMALITALGTIMLPRMSNMLASNTERKKVESIFNKSIVFAMFCSTSICFGMMAVSKELIPLFLGDGYEKCIVLTYIIMPSCVFVAFANVIRTQYMLPRKMDKQFVASLFAGALVNLLFNIIMIPRLGAIGAAIGTLVSEVVVCVIQSICVFNEANLGGNILNSMPFIVSGIVMFALLSNFTLPIQNTIQALLFKIIIGAALYLIILGVFFARRGITYDNSGKS